MTRSILVGGFPPQRQSQHDKNSRLVDEDEEEIHHIPSKNKIDDQPKQQVLIFYFLFYLRDSLLVERLLSAFTFEKDDKRQQ